MKQVFFWMICGMLLTSCTDEKPSGNFLDATTWRCIDVGSVYNSSGGLVYSYQEIHTISFTGTTFTHTLASRYDKNQDGIYEEEETAESSGSYKFEYPETKLVSDDGKFSEVITIESDIFRTEADTNGKYLIFTRVKE